MVSSLAYRLHNFLLQPRGVQPIEVKTMNNAEQTFPSKPKKVVGKIRVEGKISKSRFAPVKHLETDS